MYNYFISNRNYMSMLYVKMVLAPQNCGNKLGLFMCTLFKMYILCECLQ